MIRVLGLLILLYTGVASAQQAGYKIIINPYAGYDWNLIKSPRYYESATQSDSSLWANAPNTGISLRALRFSDKKRHVLDVGVNVKRSLMPEGMELTASDVEGSIAYKYDGKKWLDNQLKLETRRFVRTGAEDQDNLFGQPLSYGKVTLSNTFSAKLNKKWRVDLKPFYINKNYHNDRFEQFRYQDAGVYTNLRFKKKHKRWVEYSVYTNTHWRNYDIINALENESDEELELDVEVEEEDLLVTHRNWTYLEGGVGYKVSLNKTSKLMVKARVVQMEDIVQQRFGYFQKGIQVKYTNKYKKWKNSVSLSFNQRNYTHFTTLFNGEPELLQYSYIRCLGSMKYQIKDNLNLTMKYGVRARVSNVNDLSNRFYRSYFMSDFSMGLQWTISGVKKRPEMLGTE